MPPPWAPVEGEEDAYRAEVAGTVWLLTLVADGVAPGGWRLRRGDNPDRRFVTIAPTGMDPAAVFRRATMTTGWALPESPPVAI